jgi:diaminopimelate decarboxylase
MRDVFHYRDGRLTVDDVAVSDVAEVVPTPFYVYGVGSLVERYRALERAFAGSRHLHCVAMKANAQPALLRPLVAEGAGAEVVSGAELALALEVGFAPDRIVFSGVGKTERELRAGLRAGIRAFLVESEIELHVLEELAAAEASTARVALRFNPDIDPETHPHIATGISTAKFGVDPDVATALYRRHREFPHLEFSGVHSHIGSQITSLGPLAENAAMLSTWVKELRDDGVPIRFVDVGGGLGIPYRGDDAPGFARYAESVIDALSGLDVEIVTEPGRALFGPVGAFVVRVLYVKSVHARRFVIVDAGMNDLIRPALYGAYHRVVPWTERAASGRPVDVAGAVCESSDVFARGRNLPELARGDGLAVLDTGAYGFVMSSNYNLRPRCAEVVIDAGTHHVVREAETEVELVARELGRR